MIVSVSVCIRIDRADYESDQDGDLLVWWYREPVASIAQKVPELTIAYADHVEER